jgi:hypothetical protein
MTGSSSPDVDDGVVVDVVFEDGVLHLELMNLADRPALGITCAFDPPLADAAGRDVAGLGLFRRMEFLGPRRRVRTLLGSAGREGPARVSVTCEFERPGGGRRSTTVTHDLSVYRELAYRV